VATFRYAKELFFGAIGWLREITAFREVFLDRNQ
jgi:hypothetical protein